MLIDPSELPPEAVPEEIFIKSSAKRMTVYKVPPASQGPEIRRDPSGKLYLAYMYNYYLFTWYYGQATVQIYHGYIGGTDNWLLPWTFNTDAAWEGRTDDGNILVKKGREWAVRHDESRKR